MQELVTLEQAKRQCNLRGTSEFDEQIEWSIQVATAYVLYEAKQRIGSEDVLAARDAEVNAWTDDDETPEVIMAKAAILALVTYLMRFRGDDPDGPSLEYGNLPPLVKMFVKPLRDPALA